MTVSPPLDAAGRRRSPATMPGLPRWTSAPQQGRLFPVLQRVQAGTVKLTAPLSTYLPEYPNREVATKVTIHQPLTHTGGTAEIPFFDVIAHRKQLRTLADFVKRSGKRGLEFEPGRCWAYSNYGFLLLGVVIENVTGQSYYASLQQHVYAARRDDQERIAARKPNGC